MDVWDLDLGASLELGAWDLELRPQASFAGVRRVGLVEVLLCGEFRKRLEVFGAKRIGDRVFLVQPFAEVDQPATFGAKRPEGRRKPITRFPAGRALNVWCLAHDS